MQVRLSLLLLISFLFTACQRKHTIPAQQPVILQADSLKYTAHYRHGNLSQQFDLEIDFNVYHGEEGDDSAIVKATVINKADKRVIDTIVLTSVYYYDMHFKSDTNVRSYTTHVNEEREIADDYYGDVIVADFNFDGLDDIAILKKPMNAMDIYGFYIQNKAGKFEPDAFLNDSVQCFPSLFDANKKELTTYVRVGCCNMAEHIYKLTEQNWLQTSHKLLHVE